MDAVNASLLDAVCALFLAEAGGVAGEGLRKLAFGYHLVDELAYHRVLAGSDEVQILALDLIHHCVHVGLAHDALDDIAVDHERRDAVGEALSYHEIPCIGQHRRVQAGDVSHEVVKAVAGDTAGGIHVNAVEALHNLGVVGDGEVGNDRLAEALDLDIAAVVRTDGNGVVNDVRDGEHDGADALAHRGGSLLKLGQTVGIGLDLRLDLFGFFQFARILLRLTHQHADLLGQRISRSTKVIALGESGTVLHIELQNLVNEGELCVLKLLPDVFLNFLGIFSYELYIKHF